MQLLGYFTRIFQEHFGSRVFLKSYQLLLIKSDKGLMEKIEGGITISDLKKQKTSLKEYFREKFKYIDPKKRLKELEKREKYKEEKERKRQEKEKRERLKELNEENYSHNIFQYLFKFKEINYFSSDVEVDVEDIEFSNGEAEEDTKKIEKPKKIKSKSTDLSNKLTIKNETGKKINFFSPSDMEKISEGGETYSTAIHAFVSSLAPYSVLTYLLAVKDR